MTKKIKSLADQSLTKRVHLPMHWKKITLDQKGFIAPFPDTSNWSPRKLKWWLTRQIKISNHFQAMFYAKENEQKFLQ